MVADFRTIAIGRGGVGRVREQHFPRAPSHRLRTIRGMGVQSWIRERRGFVCRLRNRFAAMGFAD